MLIASIDASVFAVEFFDPFSFPLFDVQCVTSFNFLQDGNWEICDVMISLGEVLACGLADITIFDIPNMLFNPSPEFPFCFPHILHAATSFQAGHYIYHPGSTAVHGSINVYNNSSDRWLQSSIDGNSGKIYLRKQQITNA